MANKQPKVDPKLAQAIKALAQTPPITNAQIIKQNKEKKKKEP